MLEPLATQSFLRRCVILYHDNIIVLLSCPCCVQQHTRLRDRNAISINQLDMTAEITDINQQWGIYL
jgi:hypothetical protein